MDTKRLTVRVGTFVIIGLLLLAGVVFTLGGESGVFARYVQYSASFDSIEGLKSGAPVRLAGVEIGQVSGISFFPDPSDKRVQVRLKVLARFGDRIRGDTTATIGSRGLLGDKVVDLSLGSPEFAAVEPGAELKVGAAADYTEMIKKGAQVLDNTVAITNDVKEMVHAYNTPELRDSVTGAVAATNDILQEVREGKGALHALIFDAQTGAQVKGLLADASGAARRAEAAIGRVDSILAQVQKGDSFAGALLYDPAGKDAVKNLSAAADEIGNIAEAVRTEKSGMLHQLVYGGEPGQPNMGEELSAAASDLREIVAKVKNGDGSLGALINDPTVYEDLKSVLGNVKRNRIIRELVRYSISKSDKIEHYGQKQ